MKVKDQHGQTWRVTRRWVPWRRRLKGSWDLAPDLPMGSLGDDPISAIVGIVFLIILLPFLVLVLIAGLELLVILAVLPFAVLGRMAFGKHWHVEVRRGFTPVYELEAGGWRASGERIQALAGAIQRGDTVPQNLPG